MNCKPSNVFRWNNIYYDEANRYLEICGKAGMGPAKLRLANFNKLKVPFFDRYNSRKFVDRDIFIFYWRKVSFKVDRRIFKKI